MEITVIIPLFNKRSTIARALESVYAQRSSPAEVIVVDDGSTDDGSAIAKSIATKHKSIPTRIIGTENRGVSAARNLGIELAATKYVALLDADDQWLPNHIEELVELMLRHNNVDLFGAKIITKSDSGSICIGPEEFIKLYSKNMTIIDSSSCVISRELAMRVGGFPTENALRGEDIVFWVLAGCASGAAFTNLSTSYIDKSSSGIQQRRSVLPATVYHLYPKIDEFPQSLRAHVRKVVRKNIVFSLVASWPIDEALIKRVIVDVGQYDQRFSRVIVISVRIGIFHILVGLRRTLKWFRLGRPL